MNRMRWLGFVLAAGLLAGCEDGFDHRPPAGQGSLIVANSTSSSVEVFLDGIAVERVRSGRDRAYDLAPGVHRMVLREDDRFFGVDVDILQDRLTVAEVREDPDGRTFQVLLRLE